MLRNGKIREPAVIVVAAFLGAGCVVAAAGAGAGGAVYFTGNGVESIVAAPLDDALQATERAFAHFELTRTEYKEEDGGSKRRLKGKTGDQEMEVTVTLEAQDDASTRLEVTARKSLVTWDKEYARRIAERIVELVG